MARFDPLFQRLLDDRAQRRQLRRLAPVTPLPDGRVLRDGRVLVNFAGNDYLGLSQHPLLAERAGDWAARHGSGAGASRLVSGTSALHMAVEARIAALKGTEAALLFASGWQANATVIPALCAASDGPALLFTDRLNHASLHHGCAAAGIRQVRFRHNDLAHLDSLLTARVDTPGLKLIVTESVFSMDGDRADIKALSALAARHNAFLYLDEAHATGVLGAGGAGLGSDAPGGVDLLMGTFSKAMGSFGAYVAGSRALCDYLANAASGFVYTTALPPPLLGAIDAALDLLPTLDAPRARLADHGAQLRAALRAAGFDCGPSTTQIVPVILGEEERTLAISARLANAGYLTGAIRPPTVPAGTSRLRIALSAAHKSEDIAALADALRHARDAG